MMSLQLMSAALLWLLLLQSVGVVTKLWSAVTALQRVLWLWGLLPMLLRMRHLQTTVVVVAVFVVVVVAAASIRLARA